MCLAIPMEIVELLPQDKALVQQGNVQVEADISLLEDPEPGDFVIVHAGYAIETLEPEEAYSRIEMFKEFGDGIITDEGDSPENAFQ